MNKLPNEIINKIMLFNSHPVADLFKEVAIPLSENLNRQIYPSYNSDDDDYFCYADEMSFAEYFFFDRREEQTYKRCYDEWMAERAEMEYDEYYND